MSDMLLTAYNGAILGPIAKVLGWVMNGIYALMSMIGIENVGLSIIIFTIAVSYTHLCIGSISVIARTRTFPRPVR